MFYSLEKFTQEWQHRLYNNPTLQNALAILYALAVPVIYTVVTVVLFNFNFIDDRFDDLLGTMTCGFLFAVPIVMGALTVAFSPVHNRKSLAFSICQPWISVFLTLIAVSALAMEAVICLVMALPIFLILASVGGVLIYYMKPAGKMNASLLGLLMLAPYIITPVEMQTPNADTIYTVQNQIVIDADIDTVWQNIIEVPMIDEDEHEHGFSLFHLLGLPKPLEATLSHEGIGGVRHASFQNNLVFIEEITEWTDRESLSFTIERDKQRMLNGALNEIGGQYFNVIDGTYRIEPVDEDTVILHLDSTHRLSTRFDFYGGLWTKWVMWDLQQYILQVIEERCEQA